MIINIIYNVWDVARAVLRGLCIALNLYIRRKNLKIGDLSFFLNKFAKAQKIINKEEGNKGNNRSK